MVNDVGAEVDGTGVSSEPAEAVAAEIRAQGGQAVSSAHDVISPAGAAASVAVALETYGRLDVLVNNAGILRDRSFAKMTSDDFDAVIGTHLCGSAYSTLAAWQALRESGSGRVIMTSSASGLFGNFGQANYGAAKLGLVGLVNVLKLEGARHSILVNAVAPVARTRMTERLLPDDVAIGLDPELVSPVVCYFASAGCDRTGLVLTVGGGLLSRVQVVESPAVPLARDDQDSDVALLIAKVHELGFGESYESGDSALVRVVESARSSRA